MYYKKEEKMIRKLDNPAYKGVKPIAEELKEQMKEMDLEQKQKFIDDLYRNLSDTGIRKLNKVVAYLNKENEQLKTHTEIMQEYKEQVNKINTLFKNYGDRYGKENVGVDNFIRNEFYDIMSKVKSEHIQEVVDQISRTTNSDAFRNIAKRYGEENMIRVRISDLGKAYTESDRLAAILKNNSDEQEEAIQEFKFQLMESERAMKPEDFQAVINYLDQNLDYSGRKLLDSTIKRMNLDNRDKYETRRIRLTEKEKDQSWQKFSFDTVLKRQLRAFRDQLKEIRDSREKRDKYDHGVMNDILKNYTRLTKLVTKVMDFVKNSINYYRPEEKADFTSFYSVMHDAYKEKGKELINLVNTGDKEAAEKLFIKDLSYIHSLDPKEKDEFFAVYAESLNKAIQNEASIDTRNFVRNLISNYEFGLYNEQIQQNVKDRNFWETEVKEQEEKQPEEAKELNKEQQPEEPVISANHQRVINNGIMAEEARNIGKNVADLDSPDAVMEEFTKQLGAFSYNHNDLDKKAMEKYIKIAASSLILHNPSKKLELYLSQCNDKYFRIDSVGSRISVMLSGADQIEHANRIRKLNNLEFESGNVLKDDIHKSLKNALSELSPKEQQEFIQKLASRTKFSGPQYILAIEAKSFGLHLSSIKSKEQLNKEIVTIAENYKNKAEGKNKAYDTYKSLVSLSERGYAISSPQEIHSKVKDIIKDNPEAIKIFEKNAERYFREFPLEKQQEKSERSVSEERKEENKEVSRDINVGLGQIKKVQEPQIKDMGYDQQIETLVEAFNSGVGFREQFSEWCKWSDQDTISKGVFEIDQKIINDRDAVNDFYNELVANSISNIPPRAGNVGGRNLPEEDLWFEER